MTTTKSPLRVLMMAYEIGQKALRPYSHRCNPKKFTQQLFACLVLNVFRKLDYRGLAALLRDCRELRSVIGLTLVPHFTTFAKATRRLLETRRARQLLCATVRSAIADHVVRPTVELAAMDGTGMESHHASAYYVQRQGKGGNPGKTPAIAGSRR